MAVKEAAVHPGLACDRGDGYLLAVGDGVAEGLDDPLAAAGAVRPARQDHCRLGVHDVRSMRRSGAGWRTWGMPRETAWRPRRTSLAASCKPDRSYSVSWPKWASAWPMSARMRRISSSEGSAWVRAQSSSSVAAR